MNTRATLFFLSFDPKHRQEKPYAIQYYPHDPLPRSNYRHESVSDVLLTDIRPNIDRFSLDREGFTVLRMQTALAPHQFFQEESLATVYAEEVRHLLKQHLGASRVYFHECVIRRKKNDDSQPPEDPLTTTYKASAARKLPEYGQPVAFAHVDYTRDAVVKIIRLLWPDAADDILSRRYQAINVWKPIRGPVRDWPLAVCDLTTTNPARDLVAADTVYADDDVEGYQVYYHQDQRWCYLSDHAADELLVFRNVDSLDDDNNGVGIVAGGVPHCAFAHPSISSRERPEKEGRPALGPGRESVELRCFVFY